MQVNNYIRCPRYLPNMLEIVNRLSVRPLSDCVCPICMCVPLSVCASPGMPVWPLSACVSHCLYVCPMSVCMSPCVPCLSECSLSVYVSHVCLCVPCLSVCLHICLCVPLSGCVSPCLALFPLYVPNIDEIANYCIFPCM
jgi:hypothetical protein